jgi:subtilisin family serine protease
VNTDFDLYLVNTLSGTVAASSQSVNGTTQKPFEFAAFLPGNPALLNYQVVIGRMSGTGTPRIKWVNSDNGSGSINGLEYPVSANGDTVGPTIFGHNGAANTQTIGAVPFSDSSTVESYSSRGPVTHLFGPVDGVTPAAALGSPQVINKPDVVATDAAQNTFFGTNVGGGLFRFFGTSQASPHAAAVAALQLSAEPTLTQTEVKDNQKSSAVPVGSLGPLVAGSGLIDARAALIAGDKTAPTLSSPVAPASPSR